MVRRFMIAVALPLLAVLVATAGCGGGEHDAGGTRGVAALKGDPALARTPARPDEILLRGQFAPRVSKPLRFDGRYVVRFEQYAPEDPHMDFAAQTSFVVDLERSSGTPSIKLFEAAAATGRRTVRLHGTYAVDVSFGDFPYVLRFTPARR